MDESSVAEVGTWHLDMATGLFSGDRVAEALFEQPFAEPTGLASLTIHPDDKASVTQVLRDCFDLGTHQTIEFRFVLANGQTRRFRGVARRVDILGMQPRYLAGTIIDVSEQRPACDVPPNPPGHVERTAAQLRAFLDTTSDCVFVVDRDWRFAFLNQRAIAEIARGRALIGESIWDAFPDLDDTAKQRYRLAMREQQPQTFETYYAPIETWYDVHAAPIDGGMAVFFRNITERKRSEQALREREQQLATVFGQAMVGILHRTLDSRVLMANGRFCEIIGRNEEELRELSFAEYTHPDDLEWNRRLFEKHAATGEPFQVEKRYVRPDGSVVWCAVNVSFVRAEGGKVQSCVVVAQDITARRTAELALESGKELLQTVIDSVSDLIFVKDREGRFVLTNRALDQGCGELEGLRTGDLFSQDLALGYEAVDQEVFSTGEARTVEETIPICGEPRVFQTVKVPWIRNGEKAGIIGVSRDITERKQAELALQESESLNRTLIETGTDCIKMLDLDGNLLFLNGPGMRAMEIEDFEEFRGKPWAPGWPKEAQPKILAAIRAAREGRIGRFSAECPTIKGTVKWWDVVMTPCIGENGRPNKIVGISRDMTQQKFAEDQVRWSATHDSLTNLPNRALFQERLAQAIQNAERRGRKVGLLHLDVDHFKQINDSLGHDAGDLLLQTFAERLQGVVRADDTVARLGGDEFAIILPAISSEQDVTLIVESILNRMREPFVYSGRILDCRASIGASIYPLHGASPEELLKHADIALYVAKSSGRGGLMVFHSEMRSELQKRSSMIALAREAITDGRVIPFYQPKIDFASNRIAGFEALLRWRHPSGGIQAPSAIAAAFEDLEVAAAISNRIVQRTIADMRRWLDRGIDFGHVAVNAAAAEFRNDNFAERVLEELHRAEVPTRHFQLEVTETVFLGRGSEYVARALNLLSAEGVKIALDDFGTGYASLSHLKQFPVDVIKIDQSFVRDLEDDPDDAAIIRAVLRLGHSLGIKIVAEGIETQAQARYLRRLRCDYGQGHLFSKAVLAAKVPALLADWQPGQDSCPGSSNRIVFPAPPPEEFIPVAKAAIW